jgi:hypothetical protein
VKPTGIKKKIDDIIYIISVNLRLKKPLPEDWMKYGEARKSHRHLQSVFDKLKLAVPAVMILLLQRRRNRRCKRKR